MLLGVCLSALLAANSLPILCTASQLAFEYQPKALSVTLVDLLSNDADYTSVLKLLQRARLIPTLNKLNGSTFFAPTNDAIERQGHANPLWNVNKSDGEFEELHDNVQEQLRQQLLYHILNYTTSLPSNSAPAVQVERTLHFPRTSLAPPSQNPPPHSPWMPIPGGTLGGEPQRLRVAAREDETWVGVDAFGKDGVQVVKGKQVASNGVLYGIADVLVPPSDLSVIVAQQSSVSYFYKIWTPAIISLLNKTSELSLFLPVDSAWEAIDKYERLYLESEYATDDLSRILNMHAVVEKNVKYTNSFDTGLNLTTIGGTNLEIVVTSGKTTISEAQLIQPDIYASNGVLHLISSLLLPPGTLKLTPEKYLLALNCTSFVSLLHSVDLTQLINDTEVPYTILALQDDILAPLKAQDLPENGSPELKKLLQYHFIPGRWTPHKLKNGMLLDTSLEEDGLGGGRQVMAVEVAPGDKKKSPDRSINFGGAGVIGNPIEVNNTLIYFVSRPLVPPADPLQTALPFLDLSSFLAAIFSTSQAEVLRSTPRTSLLIPHNVAFKRLGLLVSGHLLAPSSKQDLEKVLLHHALDGIEYSHSLQNGSQHSYPTLEGSDLKVDRFRNGTVYVSSSGGWAGMKAELYPRDTLTETGVIHEVSDILIPRSVELTVEKLMRAAKGSIMTAIVYKAGFDWILNGTSPPEGSPWAGDSFAGVGWTILCPTDEAFKEYDLTKLYADSYGLRTIVMQHTIPTPADDAKLSSIVQDVINTNRPLDMTESTTYSSLRSSSSAYGDIVFRQQVEDKGIMIGIKGGRVTDGPADWARVLSWGRSTTGSGTGGVIQIDRLVVPYQPAWWFEYGLPSSVGVLGVGAICLFFYGVRIVWRRDTTEATYEPVGGFGRDDDP